MDAHRETGWDRREWLVTVARGATVAGTVTAAATLLARGGPVQEIAPCGVVGECPRCVRLAGCPLRRGDESSTESKRV